MGARLPAAPTRVANTVLEASSCLWDSISWWAPRQEGLVTPMGTFASPLDLRPSIVMPPARPDIHFRRGET
jgi:hypothetical protein